MNHIQLITHLAKNAPNHRNIAIPTFFVIGLLFPVTGIATSLFYNHQIELEGGLYAGHYRFTSLLWLSTFTVAASSFLISSKLHTAKHQSPPANAALKHLITSVAPILMAGLVIAGSIAANYWRTGSGLPFAASTIITFYALALLSLRVFLPTSARVLATILLALGITTWLASWKLIHTGVLPAHLANLYLILAGLLHIIAATGSLLFENSAKTNQ